MKGRHLRRRFSLQPSFMKDDNLDDKHKSNRDKVDKHEAEEVITPTNVRHKIVVMGAAKVGKSSIIQQFLYNTFPLKYKRTVEEMHHGYFSVSGVNLTLDILDTSGSYEFPAMRALSISSAEAFILVYDIADASSFEEVRAIRDHIHEIKGTPAVPIVVVANKIDLEEINPKLRKVDRMTESVVTVDWENGYVEASSKDNNNVGQIFKELLVQAKITYNLSPALRRRRRQSLPPQQIAGGSHMPHSAGPASVHLPSTSQLQHLQQIQEKNVGGKRNSCVIS